ncbi:MAG: ATP-binding protein [Muribaculaceae bacterium]|nr:ATP-binding protein [Muribaculaceae bacterium]
MERKIYNRLLEWKRDARRKPLILKGARQVGKSWILKEFGLREYDHTAYISFDNDPLARSIFIDFDIPRIIRNIEALTKVPILPHSTLIILDEVQEVKEGLTALKYFCENAPEYHVAVAGSLLGITLNEGISFPVGKVDFLEMYPMDFEEFLWANGEKRIADAISSQDTNLLISLQNKTIDLLRQYYFVGGMPEAVLTYVETGSVLKVRQIQDAIIEAYRNDISKHAPLKEVQRIHLVLNSLPAQLARENRKFIYSAIKKGGRAAEFELAIQWLVDAGIVLKVCRTSLPKPPLKIYEDFNSFKLYFLDCGLYAALAGADPASIIIADPSLNGFKGAFSEQYVLQQFLANGIHPIYYFSTDDSRMEIDFLFYYNGIVYPVEVKAGGNVNGRSIKIFREKYELPFALRLSLLQYKQQEHLINIPLYSAFTLPEALSALQ